MGDYAAGLTAAVGGLAALLGVRRFGPGDHVDVSMLEAATTIFNAYMTVQAELVGRGAMPAMARYAELPSVERAADGWVGFATNSAPQFRAFAEMVGHPEWADDPELSRADRRGWHVDDLRPAITAWTSARSVAQILELAGRGERARVARRERRGAPRARAPAARDVWVENPGCRVRATTRAVPAVGVAPASVRGRARSRRRHRRGAGRARRGCPTARPAPTRAAHRVDRSTACACSTSPRTGPVRTRRRSSGGSAPKSSRSSRCNDPTARVSAPRTRRKAPSRGRRRRSSTAPTPASATSRST